ncbi:LOW QUALITY PROTEIN: lymphocyte antigen 6B-like [Zalophus californianus]|uniref:LOW QUALITY PROTEIN: lymphocyte antigen 6B-like n=1 Tax=Zalophus californianus TaxID=9704 RepID=A0A6J2BGI8_ZALCA|nr:LOW QUALITY PROTEIN: lymphocyte antigen 6B-like [Zalophus californianus]
MRAIVLLAALLCQGGAWALRCHNCTNTEGSTCSGPTVCPRSAQACLSQKLSMDLHDKKLTVAVKTCAQSCENPPPTQPRASVKEMRLYLYCCETDLCNGVGNQGLGATAMGLMLVASVLVTLPGAFL